MWSELRTHSEQNNEAREWERTRKRPAAGFSQVPLPFTRRAAGERGRKHGQRPYEYSSCSRELPPLLFPPFSVFVHFKRLLNGSLVPPKRPRQIMQACLVTQVTK